MWLEPSRRHLFAHISIPLDSYQSWPDDVPPTNTGLLRHVRSLKLRRDKTSNPQSPIHALRHYFPSFSKLQSITFCGVDIEPTVPEELGLFSAFQHTLSSLSFFQVSITWASFVAFIGYFPYLKTLWIFGSSFRLDRLSIPHVSHTLRGRLFIDSSSVGLFVDRFPELRQEYEELTIISPFEPRLAAPSEGSLKHLKIQRCKRETVPDLSRFTELCRLDIFTRHPEEQERNLISSITSMNFRKITLIFSGVDLRWEAFRDDTCWALFDDTICGLADRLRGSGCKHSLEVDFWTMLQVPEGAEHYWCFLPRFREKGRVRIVAGHDAQRVRVLTS